MASLYLNIKSVTAQNEKTIEYLKAMANTLLEGKYPSATAGNLHELMFDYKDGEFSSTIQIDDVDGYFIETLSQLDKSTQIQRDKFMQNLELSEGIIFFFPYQRLFDKKSIKEFNYQIDTIISKIKKIYHDRNSIPIPAVIAVSKWDSSPFYKCENEIEKAIEYIESNNFLRLAKEKIEINFSKLKVIPLSAIGKDINRLEPYNLEKPIKFFLEETYSNWIERVESLKEDKEAQFIFLSKVYFDIKVYKNGFYDRVYRELESEYSKKLFKKLDTVKNIEEYEVFEEKYRQIVNALFNTNRDKILEIKKRLTTQKKVKIFSGVSIGTMVVGVAIVVFLGWKAQTLLIKDEVELFSDIQIEYKTNNYTQALEDISDYLSAYENTVNIEHKNRVIEIKSIIEKTQIVTKAKNILNDSSFINIDEIDEIFTSFSEMGIDESELNKQLIVKKDRLLIEEEYNNFKKMLKNKIFADAIIFVESNWKSNFEEKNQVIIKNLDNKFNIEVEKLLKSISYISNIDEYNNLVNKLNKITSLKDNSQIDKLEYKASINSNNQNNIDKQLKIKNKYNYLLKNGIKNIKVSFGAQSENNEPLGFICGGEDEIILEINSIVYHFEQSDRHPS